MLHHIVGCMYPTFEYHQGEATGGIDDVGRHEELGIHH
jgi:hypothetical protein